MNRRSCASRTKTRAEERGSSREVQKSTFARFFGLFDFRLLEQYRPKPEVGLWEWCACEGISKLEINGL